MKNVGSLDRLIRLVLGLALVFGGIAKSGGFGCVFTIVGIVITYTGIAGSCFLYSALDINTRCQVSDAKG